MKISVLPLKRCIVGGGLAVGGRGGGAGADTAGLNPADLVGTLLMES